MSGSGRRWWHFFTGRSNLTLDVLPVEAFRKELDRERSRVERSGSSFAVLAFEAPRPEDVEAQRAASSFIAQVRQRLRATDELGWLNDGQIGMLLPETDYQGCCHVRDSLESLAGDLDLRCELYIYPADLGGRHGDLGADERGEPTAQLPIDASSQTPETTAPLSLEERFRMMPLFLKSTPWWKRLVDVGSAGFGLLLISPLMLAVALAVKCSSRGPVFFCQSRVGQGGKLIPFFKFRTMVVNAEQLKQTLTEDNEQKGPVFKMKRDPRITSVGRILRKLSLDELPQLWNVVRGDMSLVGPRPPTPDEVLKYELWQWRRLEIRPGITCIWQVSGRCEIQFEDWMRMDIRYGQNRTLAKDVGILAQTVPAVISGKGAY